jgi:acyl CoA:acetate/3-ketoacid CoA transferase beta subunit
MQSSTQRPTSANLQGKNSGAMVVVIDVTADGFLVREILDELSHEELQNRSGARLSFNENCSELTAPNLLTN